MTTAAAGRYGAQAGVSPPIILRSALELWGGERQRPANEAKGHSMKVNKDPDLRKRMFEGGFEVIDITLEMMPAFMKERTQEYLNSARSLGLVK